MNQRCAAQMARSGEFDLWQFEWMAYADAVTGVPGTRSLLIAHNVESLIWKRYCQTEKSPAKRLYLQQQYRKFRRYERKLMRSVSGVVCVSEDDARLAREGFSPRKAWVVDNGIDREFFEAAHATRQPGTILFLLQRRSHDRRGLPHSPRSVPLAHRSSRRVSAAVKT